MFRKIITRPLMLLVAIAGLAVAGAATAQAQTQAAVQYEACVFDAPMGAELDPVYHTIHAGHVGWGFQMGANKYWYGATEGPGVGKKWNRQGTRSQMMNDFKIGGPVVKQTGYYVTRRCGSVPNTNLTAAYKAVHWVQYKSEYAGIGNNCMDNVYRILQAYGVSNLPSTTWPVSHWFPNNWYKAFPWGQYNL